MLLRETYCNTQSLLQQFLNNLPNLLVCTEVKSLSVSILIRSCVVYISLHLVTEVFRNTYLSGSSNISRWATCAGIWRSCAYTASNRRTRNRPCQALWMSRRRTEIASPLNLTPDFIHDIS